MLKAQGICNMFFWPVPIKDVSVCWGLNYTWMLVENLRLELVLGCSDQTWLLDVKYSFTKPRRKLKPFGAWLFKCFF